VDQKPLMVFEISKPERSLCAASMLTIIIHSEVRSFVEREHWSVLHRIAGVEVFL